MLDPWGERRDGTRDEGGRGCEIHTCEAELRAISPAAKLSFPRNSCAEPFLPAKRLRQIFLSRRETGWRTLIWVLSGVRRKIGHLFAYSVGGRFFYPKYCASRIYGFGSPFAYFVGDSLRGGRAPPSWVAPITVRLPALIVSAAAGGLRLAAMLTRGDVLPMLSVILPFVLGVIVLPPLFACLGEEEKGSHGCCRAVSFGCAL